MIPFSRYSRSDQPRVSTFPPGMGWRAPLKRQAPGAKVITSHLCVCSFWKNVLSSVQLRVWHRIEVLLTRTRQIQTRLCSVPQTDA